MKFRFLGIGHGNVAFGFWSQCVYNVLIFSLKWWALCHCPSITHIVIWINVNDCARLSQLNNKQYTEKRLNKCRHGINELSRLSANKWKKNLAKTSRIWGETITFKFNVCVVTPIRNLNYSQTPKAPIDLARDTQTQITI